MGGGIAMACTNAGLEVLLHDASREGLDRGVQAIQRNYAVSVTRKRFTDGDVAERMARITPQLDLAGFDTVDVVIEAVFEDMALKREIFGALDREREAGRGPGHQHVDARHRRHRRGDVAPGGGRRPALLQPRQRDAAPRDRPRPAPRPGRRWRHRSPWPRSSARWAWWSATGPGFVGNRMMFPYMYETQYLVEEGATPEQVDAALTGFGMAMGMFAVDDMAGIDVAIRAQQALGHFSRPGERRPLVQSLLVEAGRLGQKTGKGWYVYGDDRKPKPDPEVVDLIRAQGQGRRDCAARDHERGNRRARDLRADQRGGARPRGGPGAAARRTSTRST